MHVHEQKWTDNKKIDDEVTLSHVGKSTIQSRRTKYHKNGTLIEEYNASRRLKVQASRVPGAVYQWPTMQKHVLQQMPMLQQDLKAKQYKRKSTVT